MARSPASISFQLLDHHDEQPNAGYELTKASFELPSGAHVPRVGEFMEWSNWTGINDLHQAQYVVLAVNTRASIFEKHPDDLGWHTIVTLGPTDKVPDKRLLQIAV